MHCWFQGVWLSSVASWLNSNSSQSFVSLTTSTLSVLFLQYLLYISLRKKKKTATTHKHTHTDYCICCWCWRATLGSRVCYVPGLCQIEMSWRRVVHLTVGSHRSKVNDVLLQNPPHIFPVAHSKVKSHFLRRYIHFITVTLIELQSDMTCCRCCRDIAGTR